MTISRLFRTSSFRLTLLYAGVFVLSALLLFAAVFWSATATMRAQIDRTVSGEAAEVLSAARDAPLRQVVEEFAARSPDMRYLLEDAGGAVLAGNLAAMPPRAGPGAGPVGDGPPLLGRGTVLGDGRFLFVGASAVQLRELEEVLRRALLGAVLGTVLLGVAGGVGLAGLVLRRIEAVARTSRDIVAGDLGQRIALRGTGDEFDQLAAGLNAMLDRIQSLMQGLQQVSNDIAHDLRTPLTRMRQRLELARDGEADAAALRAALDRSVADVDAILDTFGALLRIAQVEAGTRRAGFSPVDLRGVAERLVDAYGPAMEEDGRTLLARLDAVAPVEGDAELLTQMLANLLDNAVRHTPSGTVVTLALRQEAAAIAVRVSDDGPGIPAPERGQVLRRFYRRDASRATPGSGLGLSMVAAIATLHDATLELGEGDAGTGLAVTIRLRLSGTGQFAAMAAAAGPR